MRGCRSLAALAALLLAAPLPAEGLTRHVSHATVDAASDAGMQLLPRERLLWKKAVKEAGLDPEKISEFGKAAAKFPKSWVDQIGKMNHTKKYRFFFQGMGFTQSDRYHRAWLFRFVHKKFKPNVDFIRLTDQKRKGYMSLGRDFDFTNKGTEGGFIPTRAALNQKAYFDTGYYQNMVQSNFTLCPGGQQPWSTRIYEAAMAKSIPIIHKEDHDFTLPDHADWLPKIGYTYLKGAEYDEKVIDENYRLFIKYQTFIEGDNEPPSPAASKQEVAKAAKASPAGSKKAEGSDNATSSAAPAAHEGGEDINATNTTEAVAKTVEKGDANVAKVEEQSSAKNDAQVSLRAKGTAATVDQAFEEATRTEEGSTGGVTDKIQEVEGSGAAEEAEASAKEEAQEEAAAEAEAESQESKEEAAEAAEGDAQESAEEAQEDTQEEAAAEDAREGSGEEVQEVEQAGGEEHSAEAGEAAEEEAAEDAEGEVVDASDGGGETEYKEQAEEGGGDEEQPQAAQQQGSPRSKQTASYLSGGSRIVASGEGEEAEEAEDDAEEVEEVDAAEAPEEAEADADEEEAEPPARAARSRPQSRRSEAKRAQKFRGVAHKKSHRRK